MKPKLDHLVFGCRDLESGAEALSARLHARPGGRGVHDVMGTHNALWRMGDAYIELIAIDPAAPHPGRPRWFGLDDPDFTARLADGPRLLTWAMGVRDLAPVLAAAPIELGPEETFARDDLSWRLSVPTSGTPGLDGVFPLTIAWNGNQHPSRMLPESGLNCASLLLSHPEIDRARPAIGDIQPPVQLRKGPRQILFDAETPKGLVTFTAFD